MIFPPPLKQCKKKSGPQTLRQSKVLPELDVQHGGVDEVWHTLDVENMLDLSPPFYDRVHRLGVHDQLWTRGSRSRQGRLPPRASFRERGCNWRFAETLWLVVPSWRGYESRAFPGWPQTKWSSGTGWTSCCRRTRTCDLRGTWDCEKRSGFISPQLSRNAAHPGSAGTLTWVQFAGAGSQRWLRCFYRRTWNDFFFSLASLILHSFHWSSPHKKNSPWCYYLLKYE